MAKRPPATVLVTTTDVERVPDVLAAGCDSVLLKPFAPNLFHARLGRLLRARASASILRARVLGTEADRLREQARRLISGTNRHWPTAHCPHCSHQGVTSFDFTRHRQAWHACLECNKVWLAKMRD